MIPLHERTGNGTQTGHHLLELRKDIFAAHAMAALIVAYPAHKAELIAENAWKMAELMVKK